MLWTNLKIDQMVKIGENITIILKKKKGNQILLGIECPKDQKIEKEIFDNEDN